MLYQPEFIIVDFVGHFIDFDQKGRLLFKKIVELTVRVPTRLLEVLFLQGIEVVHDDYLLPDFFIEALL